ncbi:TfuA-like protein [Gellertiella hungarica]|uniref:TfuA-like core domain-containing protein n=1 Tax=Gellertiella hungarica TaxID=1572859 RepID=A0A7W6NK33_9HYPH|nr:TfuA-like protein [Gellertiella hungarica]MBB4065030.1 hypothetical protein [Gellertiella hungarica]
MKIVFVGPSLSVPVAEQDALRSEGLLLLPPARRGDLLAAAEAGASVIGLIDGAFETVPSVWHKEILHALANGIAVYGAASMGALRAAECAAFGMIPAGRIAVDYASGLRIDDSDVAQLHGPMEFGYPALTEPLVTVEAVLSAALGGGVLSVAEHAALKDAAMALHFKDRTWPAMFRSSGLLLASDVPDALAALRQTVNPKRDDARTLLSCVRAAPPQRRAAPSHWTLSETEHYRRTLNPR